jgi:hypothetical protein
MIQNSEIIRKDDIFTLNNFYALRELKSKIQYKRYGSKEECQKNYDKMGNRMYKLFSKLVRAHLKDQNYGECFSKISQPDYLDTALDVEKIQKLIEKYENEEDPNLLNLKGISYYLSPSFNKNEKEITQFQLCFPDPEFLILYYKLIDTFWTHTGLRLYSQGIRDELTLHIPWELFEQEFVKNDKYPQTQVRNLQNNQFFNQLTPNFLMQNDFCNKPEKKYFSSPKYTVGHRKRLRNYQPFDTNLIKGKLFLN